MAVKRPLDHMTGQVVHRCLQRPPTADELAWIADMRAEHGRWFPGHVWEDWDTQEARRLYWEQRLGLDAQWVTPLPEFFPDDPEWAALCAAFGDALIEQGNIRIDRP